MKRSRRIRVAVWLLVDLWAYRRSRRRFRSLLQRALSGEPAATVGLAEASREMLHAATLPRSGRVIG